MEGYEGFMRDRTTIVISHRAELARRADRVLALENARIVESGQPDLLLAAGTAFARLFASTDAAPETAPPRGDRAPAP